MVILRKLECVSAKAVRDDNIKRLPGVGGGRRGKTPGKFIHSLRLLIIGRRPQDYNNETDCLMLSSDVSEVE